MDWCLVTMDPWYVTLEAQNDWETVTIINDPGSPHIVNYQINMNGIDDVDVSNIAGTVRPGRIVTFTVSSLVFSHGGRHDIAVDFWLKTDETVRHSKILVVNYIARR